MTRQTRALSSYAVCFSSLYLVSVLHQATATPSQIIYSNFGPKDKKYSCCNGADEEGAKTEYGPLAVAFSFKVKDKDYYVTQVEIPLSIVKVAGGGNAFTFVLAEDGSFEPGTQLFEQRLTGVPLGGTCCKVERVRITKSIKLVKGKSYWLEALPSPTTPGSWALVTTHISNLQSATYDGSKTWTDAYHDRAGAFAVYGVPVQ